MLNIGVSLFARNTLTGTVWAGIHWKGTMGFEKGKKRCMHIVPIRTTLIQRVPQVCLSVKHPLTPLFSA